MEDLDIPYFDPEFKFSMSFPRNIYCVSAFASAGTVIIFNQFDFSKASEILGKRYGTEKDVERLTKYFQEKNFQVFSYNDLTKDNISKKLKEHISTVDWENSGSLVLIVLTHGEENGMLWASDKPYHCSQLWDPILQEDRLKDKFKFIIMQACRGRKREKRFDLMKNVMKKTPENVASNSSNSNKTMLDVFNFQTTNLIFKSLPDAAYNLIIAHSTVEGCDSVRNREEGTWFINDICNGLSMWTEQSDPGIDLLDCLTVVNMQASFKSRFEQGEGQTTSFTSYLQQSIEYVTNPKETYSPVGIDYTDTSNIYQGRAYIYFDKNHRREAEEFSETMELLRLTPVLLEIDHGETALTHMCNVSHRNDFYYENCVIFAVFTNSETVIKNNVPLKQIYDNFSAESCTSLAGRLKLFFFFDAKYDDELDTKLDYLTIADIGYVTNHSDFLIVRGHSKEFLRSLNCELRKAVIVPAYHIISILTTAMASENISLQKYSTNFESTMKATFYFNPTALKLPKHLMEKRKILTPIFHHSLRHPNSQFTGREAEIKKLILETSSKLPGRKVITVSGISGIGKTQLVSIFCKYFAWMFNNIIWINSESEQKLRNSFESIAVKLNLISKDNTVSSSTNIIVAMVYKYFSNNEKTIFIFDNFIKEISNYLPDNVGTHEIYVIVTTNIISLHENQIPITSFDNNEAVEFLKKIIHTEKSSEFELDKLAESLGNFPLLLHISACHIRECQTHDLNYTIEQFLNEFLIDEPQNLIKQKTVRSVELVLNTDYKNSFYKICKLKTDNISRKHKMALLILYIICYCEADDIPLSTFYSLIDAKKEHNPNKIYSAKHTHLNEQKTSAALSVLLSEGLINVRHSMCYIHRFIQEGIKGIVIEENKEKGVLSHALKLIRYTLLNTTEKFKDFELHALKIYKYAINKNEYDINDSDIAILLSKYLCKYNKLNVAYELLKECCEIFDKKFGTDSDFSIYLKQELTNVLSESKRYDECLILHDNIISVLKCKYGDDSGEVMNELSKKAKCLQFLFKYDEALEILNSVLEWQRNQIKTENHVDILQTEIQLASVLIDVKEYDRALKQLQKILDIERKSGSEIHILDTLKYIALIYENDTNNEKKAIETYIEILNMQCKIKLFDPIKITKTQLKLEKVLNNFLIKNPLERENLKLQFESNIDSITGDDDITKIIAKTNITTCLCTFPSKIWQALDMIDNLYISCKKSCGEDHERTLQVLQKKAQVLRKLGRKNDAFKLYEKLMEIYKEKYGLDGFNTKHINLAIESTKKDENKIDEVILSYESFLYEKRDIVRDEIHDEIFSLYRKAQLNLEQENYTQALYSYDEIMKLEEKYFLKNDICNLITKYNKYTVCKFVDRTVCKNMIEELLKLAVESLCESHDFILLIKQEISQLDKL